MAGVALVQEGSLGPVAIAACVPAFFMTFNLLLLNEFPDEIADRDGGRRNIVILSGRRAAALIYIFAGLIVPVWIVGCVVARIFPPMTLFATLPSALLINPVKWALVDPSEAVPVPALGANVVWNLATNTLLGVLFYVAAISSHAVDHPAGHAEDHAVRGRSTPGEGEGRRWHHF